MVKGQKASKMGLNEVAESKHNLVTEQQGSQEELQPFK